MVFVVETMSSQFCSTLNSENNRLPATRCRCEQTLPRSFPLFTVWRTKWTSTSREAILKWISGEESRSFWFNWRQHAVLSMETSVCVCLFHWRSFVWILRLQANGRWRFSRGAAAPARWDRRLLERGKKLCVLQIAVCVDPDVCCCSRGRWTLPSAQRTGIWSRRCCWRNSILLLLWGGKCN